jgi:hypothetical protein
MALSDAQIVSGIAILVSGYYSAMRGGMSGYHWKMMVRVAWFSTITHLAALSCLRTYLYQNQVKRGLRLFFMGCLAVMLITATIPTASTEFRDDLPARCFLDFSRFDRSKHGDADTIFSLLLLVYNIILRALKLHRKIAEGWTRHITQKLMAPAKRATRAVVMRLASIDRYPRSRLVIHVLIVQPLVAILVLGKTYYLMYTSTVAEVRETRTSIRVHEPQSSQ